MSKWYEVPEDQERNVIHQKRKEFFPKADEADWSILKNIFYFINFKKKNENKILMKSAINFFNPPSTSEVRKFCEKFDSRVIWAAPDMQYLQINNIAYRILVDETFKDIKETRYWLPFLEQILLKNQDDQKTKTEYSEEELFKLLTDLESERILAEQRKNNRLEPFLIHMPNIDSFVIAGVASYYSVSKETTAVSLQKGQIYGRSSQEWYDDFFKNLFDIFEKPLTPKSKIKRPENTLGTKEFGKIFISCGQYHEHERLLGKKLTELVKELTPFEGYFAQNQTSLNGLSENIFRELNNCVGLVVVMHARGALETPEGKTVIRASVWIEQEVAIAAFIQHTQEKEIKIILYAENGISIEGVRTQLHLNPIVFEKNEDVENDLRNKLESGMFAENSSAEDNERIVGAQV
jgi:hypothetical protein